MQSEQVIFHRAWVTWKMGSSKGLVRYFLAQFQFSSVIQSCLTLCDPMVCSTPGLPVHHQLLEFTQTHVHRVGAAIQPSHPLLSPLPPALNHIRDLFSKNKIGSGQLQVGAVASPTYQGPDSFHIPLFTVSLLGISSSWWQNGCSSSKQ